MLSSEGQPEAGLEGRWKCGMAVSRSRVEVQGVEGQVKVAWRV